MGWVDPARWTRFEYLTHGDAATVALQYSYLPSWISYLVDQSKAREAGRALFDAVYDSWSKLPAGRRPRLFVAGESLGSFGGETAFSGEYDLRNRTSGTLFAGPPNFNTLFREFSDHRDPGARRSSPSTRTDAPSGSPTRPGPRSPAGQPVAGQPGPLPDAPLRPHRVVEPEPILGKPDWTDEAPGKDVLPGVVWIPFVTFWQITADLLFSTGVPPGHGHKYTGEYVDGWVAVLQPQGVTPEELAGIRMWSPPWTRPPPSAARQRSPWWATVQAATSASPLVATWARTGATRLRDRSRSHAKARPATEVTTTAPPTRAT